MATKTKAVDPRTKGVVIEKTLGDALTDLIRTVTDEDSEQATERVGEGILPDGRIAQLHVTLTTEVDDFLELVP